MTDCNNSPERCVLCLDQKRSPVRIQCGHSFCFGCLDVYKSYRKYPWANKCPICRDVLKEKRTTKRKYSEINVGPESTTNNLRTEIENNSRLTSNQSVTSQQINILEEFMALAADYDYSGEAENNMEDLTQDDEEYEHNDFGNDSYEEELNFYTDSEDDDYDDDNYYYFNNQEDYDLPSRNSEQLQESYQYDDEDVEVINDDEEAPYQSDSLLSRDWNSNSLNLVNSEIDWETVIANERWCNILLMLIIFIIASIGSTLTVLTFIKSTENIYHY